MARNLILKMMAVLPPEPCTCVSPKSIIPFYRKGTEKMTPSTLDPMDKVGKILRLMPKLGTSTNQKSLLLWNSINKVLLNVRETKEEW